jgi:hypothetical protein
MAGRCLFFQNRSGKEEVTEGLRSGHQVSARRNAPETALLTARSVHNPWSYVECLQHLPSLQLPRDNPQNPKESGISLTWSGRGGACWIRHYWLTFFMLDFTALIVLKELRVNIPRNSFLRKLIKKKIKAKLNLNYTFKFSRVNWYRFILNRVTDSITALSRVWVALDGVLNWIPDLLTILKHNLKLHLIIALSLISTLLQIIRAHAKFF